MNEKLKTLIIIGIVLFVAGIILATVGFGLGGFKSVQLGPDGFYVSDIITDSAAPESFRISSGEFSGAHADANARGVISAENGDIKQSNLTVLKSAWNAYFR